MMRRFITSGCILLALLMSACTATAGKPNAGTALPTATHPPATTVTPTALPTTTLPAPTPTPGAVAIGPDWQRWQDSTGYQLNIPSYLQYFPGQDDPILNEHAFIAGIGQPYVELDIQAVDQASKYLCTTGTPTTVGHGIAAREADQLTPPAGTPSAPIYFRVAFVSGGLDLTFSLFTTLSGAVMQQHYGPVWRTILASFVPGPKVGHVQPCP